MSGTDRVGMSPWLRMSPLRIQNPNCIPWCRPASGRASRAGLVQDAACGTGAQCRLVLDETEHGAMLVQVGPLASSKTATPNHVLPVIPGDRNELVECHSEATRSRSPASPDRPTKIVLRRSVESAQFTSDNFTKVLRDHEIEISMDGRGRCHDNIFVERLWWTVKHEWVYLRPATNGIEQKRSPAEFFDWYNLRRPHQALSWRTPDEAYLGQSTAATALAA